MTGPRVLPLNGWQLVLKTRGGRESTGFDSSSILSLPVGETGRVGGTSPRLRRHKPPPRLGSQGGQGTGLKSRPYRFDSCLRHRPHRLETKHITIERYGRLRVLPVWVNRRGFQPCAASSSLAGPTTHSSNGSGRHPLTVETTGSNPVCVTGLGLPRDACRKRRNRTIPDRCSGRIRASKTRRMGFDSSVWCHTPSVCG